MKKNYLRIAFWLVVVAAPVFTSCSKDEEPKNTACDIVSFSVNGEAWNINGTNITQTYPAEMAATSLTPTITLSPGATVNPPSGTAQNFFTEQGVTYTVTAEDGVTKKTYTAKATRASYTACDIVAFKVNGEVWDISSTNIAQTYPAEMAATSLTPTITLSPGATVNPPSGTAQNFFTEQGVTYTVTAEDGVTKKTYTVKATLQASGATGECTWTLTGVPQNYTLTISGSGAMGNYGYQGAPWYQYRGNIKTAVIQDGVTAIGGGAFWECGVTSVTIPNSVITIANSAFWECGVTSVTIPNSVTTIGNDAFLRCYRLTDIYVDAANMQYSSENGIVFNKDKTTLVCCPAGKTGDYVIPNSVTAIGNGAFQYCGVTSVTIPNSVTTIGNDAFQSCDVTSVTIPNSVTTIGYQAFDGCDDLTSVTIPNSVTTIGNEAFSGCHRLTDIYVDAANAQYSSENGVLFNKDKTTLVCYPGGKTGSYAIPNSVTTIDYYAFYWCQGLTVVTIPNSVTTIDYYAFNRCLGLISVVIGNSVTTIGQSAFAECSSLSDVTNLNPVPQSIYIYSDIFRNTNISACTLKVPASAVNAYKAAPVWSEFGNIVAISEEDE